MVQLVGNDYIPFRGVPHWIYPEIFENSDILETQFDAQTNGIEVVSMRDVVRIAHETIGDSPPRDFIRYARDAAEKAGVTLNDRDVRSGYTDLHKQIWRGQKWIRPKEILRWTVPVIPSHQKILPEVYHPAGSRATFLIPEYTVNSDYIIQTLPGNPYRPFDWPKSSGKMTPRIARLLGNRDLNGRIVTDSNLFQDGLMILYLEFRGDREVNVYSIFDITDKGPHKGSLLGKVIPFKSK